MYKWNYGLSNLVSLQILYGSSRLKGVRLNNFKSTLHSACANSDDGLFFINFLFLNIHFLSLALTRLRLATLRSS